jgi:hypothetical protein
VHCSRHKQQTGELPQDNATRSTSSNGQHNLHWTELAAEIEDLERLFGELPLAVQQERWRFMAEYHLQCSQAVRQNTARRMLLEAIADRRVERLEEQVRMHIDRSNRRFQAEWYFRHKRLVAERGSEQYRK